MTEHRVHPFAPAPPELRLVAAVGIVVAIGVLAWRRRDGGSHVERATGSLIVLATGVGLGMHQPHAAAWRPTVGTVGLGAALAVATGISYVRDHRDRLFRTSRRATRDHDY